MVRSCPPWQNRRVRHQRLLRHHARAAVLMLALAAGLTACTPGEAPGTAETASPAPGAAGQGGSGQGGSGQGGENAASGNQDAGTDAAGTEAAGPRADALETALKQLAGESPSPDRAGMTDAFATAGFDPAAVEVSADRTPTGLDVDAIQGAARQGGDCVFGEVRDGEVTVSVLPVLAGGRCFVGN